MNIKIRYENHKVTLDVPEEDFALMIRLDYEKRLADAKDPALITPRTPQEIMEERFNNPDYDIILAYKQADPETDQIPVSVSIEEMSQYLSVTGNTVYSRVRKMPDEFLLNKGQICRISQAQEEGKN